MSSLAGFTILTTHLSLELGKRFGHSLIFLYYFFSLFFSIPIFSIISARLLWTGTWQLVSITRGVGHGGNILVSDTWDTLQVGFNRIFSFLGLLPISNTFRANLEISHSQRTRSL